MFFAKWPKLGDGHFMSSSDFSEGDQTADHSVRGGGFEWVGHKIVTRERRGFFKLAGKAKH
jgi:hypothetical protein